MNKIIELMLYGPDGQTSEIETRAGETTAIEQLINTTIAEVTAQKDYTLASVYRGSQALADTVASLSMQDVDNEGRIFDETPKILREPEIDCTYQETMNKLVLSLVFDGNAYLLPRTRSAAGEVTSLIVASPGEVNVNWDSREVFRTYSWRNQDLEPNNEIIHISINRFPGQLKGIGPITAARFMLGGVKAEQNFAKRLFEDEAMVNQTIRIPEKLTKEEAEAILNVWEGTHKGRKRPAVLGGGATVEQTALNPVDAQFLESREFSVKEVARWLGVPPSFLGVDSGGSLTYSTTESEMRRFLTTTLNPTYLERIAAAFSVLLPRGHNARFNTKELLRADIQQRYTAYQLGIAAGFLTVNEVRKEEGLEPLPEGEVLAEEVEEPQENEDDVNDE